MRESVACLIFVMFCACIQASELNQAYQEGSDFGKSVAQQPTELLKTFDLTQIPGFARDLPQENYYGGVTQENNHLAADSQSAAAASEVSKAINESFNARPLYKINPASPEMQKLNQIADNGEAIMHGLSTDKTTCSLNPKKCQYAWQEKTCVAHKGLGHLRCARQLRVDISEYATDSFILYLIQGSVKPYNISINLTQSDTCKQKNNPCYWLTQGGAVASPSVIPTNCDVVKVHITDQHGFATVLTTPNCTNPSFSLSIGKCEHGHCRAPLVHAVTLTTDIRTRTEHWDDHCEHLQNKAQQGVCRLVSPLTCTAPNQTRLVGDVSVTRDCWQEQAVYDCGEQNNGDCESLINSGCEQTASTCLTGSADNCKAYQQTYQCPMNQCSDNELICGEEVFCLDGNCSAHDYSPASEEDFKKSISALSAASEASNGLNGRGDFVFKGERMECTDAMLNFKNCCDDKGWGVDLGLAHCNDMEKKLGLARENKLVVATGEYCADREKLPIGSFCKSTHKTFCVFQSKLARIIQEQGRRDQLHIGFGEGDGSNCSGITAEQLQIINFEKIDFREFYEEIKNKQKQPNAQQTIDGISNRLNEFYQQGNFNG